MPSYSYQIYRNQSGIYSFYSYLSFDIVCFSYQYSYSYLQIDRKKSYYTISLIKTIIKVNKLRKISFLCLDIS